jgi:hypothetical protein
MRSNVALDAGRLVDAVAIAADLKCREVAGTFSERGRYRPLEDLAFKVQEAVMREGCDYINRNAADVQPLIEAAQQVLDLIGTGKCPANQCEGCKYETAEARELLSEALLALQ